MKKLLIVDNDYSYFLSHRLPIAKACLNRGWQVHIVTPKRDQAGKQAEREGLTWHGVPIDLASQNPVREIQSIWALRELYKSLQPDLVHHLKIKPVLYGSVAARLADVPAEINALTGLGYLYMNHNFKNRIIRLFVNRLLHYGFSHPKSFLILQNDDDKKMILDYGLIKEKNIEIIRGSGVNTEEYVYSPEINDEIRVILPSRMLWDKGVGEFVQAAKILRASGAAATFHLYGEMDPKNPQSIPKKQLENWNGEDGIYYEGYKEDMKSVLKDANIVCLPSYREGLPKSLLEAASVGRPIVTTDAPGCREIVDDGINGYLVPVKDVGILTERIKELIDNPNLREEFGKRGREKVENDLSIDHVVKKTMAVYERLLKN